MRAPRPTELLDAWESSSGGDWNVRATALVRLGDEGLCEKDALALSVAERDAGLLGLHTRLFGAGLHGVTSCPACGAELELALDVDDLLSSESGEAIEVAGIVARLPTVGDVEAAAGCSGAAEARRLFAERATGAEVDDETIAAVSSALAEIAGPADVVVEVVCPSCGNESEAPLDVGAFVWAEVDAAARATLLEVDTLARAYGWSEREVLELTRARRRRYVELAET